MGIPYVFVAYCPAVLPSPKHAPPVLAMLGDIPTPPKIDHSELWAQNAQHWNDAWSPLINSQRDLLGLPPVSDVRRYVLTDRPWLAAVVHHWRRGYDNRSRKGRHRRSSSPSTMTSIIGHNACTSSALESRTVVITKAGEGPERSGRSAEAADHPRPT
jgi:hypothetical protein